MLKFFWQKTLKFGNVVKLNVTLPSVWRPIRQNNNQSLIEVTCQVFAVFCIFFRFFAAKFKTLLINYCPPVTSSSISKRINELSDNELIVRYLRDQNTDCFTVLYRRYARKVFAKCITMLLDEGLARDATQDIFVKVTLNLSKFTEQSSFSTWIYSITYNHCIDQIRRKKKMPLIFSEDVGKVSKEVEVDIPDSVLLEMKKGRLEQVMAKLPPGDRAILEMKYSEDLPIKEIGDILGKTESAIKMQIMRAKMKAQSVYQELFGNSTVDEDTLPQQNHDEPGAMASGIVPGASAQPNKGGYMAFNQTLRVFLSALVRMWRFWKGNYSNDYATNMAF